MRVEVGVHRPDVAPVAHVALGAAGDDVVLEVVGVGRALGDERRHDVAAHVVLRALQRGVGVDGVHEHVGVEDVVAHAREDLVGGVGQAVGVGRLLEEGADLGRLVGLDVDDAELVVIGDRLPDGSHGHAGAGLDVLLDHLGEVHPVDVVGADDDDDVGLLVGDRVEALEDRVGTALVPGLVDALLGRDGCDVVAEHRRHPPGAGDVPVEAVRLVLGEHDDLEVAGVDDVGQREVDQPVDASERDRRLGAVRRERHQPLPLPAREHDDQDLRTSAAVRHDPTLVGSLPRRDAADVLG